MSKSIESIWQQDFIDDMALVAPKVNDLYNQKSQNLVDRFDYLFRANHKAVLFAAFAIAVVLAFWGAPLLGAVICAMLLGLVYVGKQQLKTLNMISKELSSYDYLCAFSRWLDNSIEQYVKVYRFFYPCLFVLCTVRALNSELGREFIGSFENAYIVLGLPLGCWAFIGVSAGLLGLLGGRLYRADVTLVYGKEINKLKSLIADMEALRKS